MVGLVSVLLWFWHGWQYLPFMARQARYNAVHFGRHLVRSLTIHCAVFQPLTSFDPIIYGEGYV